MRIYPDVLSQMSNSFPSSFFSCVSNVAHAIAALATASLIFLWSKWDHMCQYIIEAIQKGNTGSYMFWELDWLRANGMVILYKYFGVPLQTTAEVRRKSKGGTSPVSPPPSLSGHRWWVSPGCRALGPNSGCQRGHGTDTPGEVTWRRQIFRKDLESLSKNTLWEAYAEHSKATEEARVMPSPPPSLEPAHQRQHKYRTLSCWDAFERLRKLFCLCAELFFEQCIKPHTTAGADEFLAILLLGFMTRLRLLSQYPTSCQIKLYRGHWTSKAKPQSIVSSLQSSSLLVMPVPAVSPVKNNHFPSFRASFSTFSPEL